MQLSANLDKAGRILAKEIINFNEIFQFHLRLRLDNAFDYVSCNLAMPVEETRYQLADPYLCHGLNFPIY